MTTNQMLGALMLLAIFGGFFGFSWRELGFKGALSCFAFSFGLCAAVWLAVTLLKS